MQREQGRTADATTTWERGIKVSPERAYLAFHPSFGAKEWRLLHDLLGRFAAAGCTILFLGAVAQPASWLEAYAALTGLVWPTREALLARALPLLVMGAAWTVLAFLFHRLLSRRMRPAGVGRWAYALPTLLLLASPFLESSRERIRVPVYETVFTRKSGEGTGVFRWTGSALAGRSIAAYRMFSYPFAGSPPTNRLHITEARDGPAWLAELRRKGVDTVILCRQMGDRNSSDYLREPRESGWIRPEGFQTAYDDGFARVFFLPGITNRD